MNRFDDRTFESDGGEFRIILTAGVIERILRTCSQSAECETGGLLAGIYSDDRRSATAIMMTGLTSDSQTGRAWMVRGVAGLKEWLMHLWRRKVAYYLGEWHFHPGVSARPSSVDCDQLRMIAGSPKYACPEPILVIVGGTPSGQWTLSATLFDGKNLITLRERRTK